MRGEKTEKEKKNTNLESFSSTKEMKQDNKKIKKKMKEFQ